MPRFGKPGLDLFTLIDAIEGRMSKDKAKKEAKKTSSTENSTINEESLKTMDLKSIMQDMKSPKQEIRPTLSKEDTSPTAASATTTAENKSSRASSVSTSLPTLTTSVSKTAEDSPAPTIPTLRRVTKTVTITDSGTSSTQVDIKTLSTLKSSTSTRSGADDEETSASAKLTASNTLEGSKSTISRTPTIDSLLPTTLFTQTSSNRQDLPLTSASLPQISELAKAKNELDNYKMMYRNMVIMMSVFAFLALSSIALGIYLFCIRRGKPEEGPEEAVAHGREKGEPMEQNVQDETKGTAPGGADYF